MTTYRFQLEKYKGMSTRHTCPTCGHSKTFTRYVDIETGEYLPEQYGKCERRNNCAHDLNPYADGYAKMIWQQERGQTTDWQPTKSKLTVSLSKTRVYIPADCLKESLSRYDQNTFIKFLTGLFGSEQTTCLIERYYIGTSSNWQGSTVFWYIDTKGNIQAGQIKCFNKSGHTVKDLSEDGKLKSRTTWIHSVLAKQSKVPQWLTAYLDNEKKAYCLFGSHLLNEELTKPVALFEAPKTAIIATPYFPDFVCLAVGALDWLTAERLESLRGRKVVLFPDLSKDGKAFEKWNARAKQLSHLARFEVSDLLECYANDSQRSEGLDMADWLVTFDYQTFNLDKIPESEKGEKSEAVTKPFFYTTAAGARVWNIKNQNDLNIFAATLPNK